MQSGKLGELVNISIGRTPSRSNNEYWDIKKERDNIWLSIADLLNVQNRTINDSKEYISDLAANSFGIVTKGTLLVSFKLTLGRLAFAGRDLRTNEAIAALKNDETKILNEYLYYFLSYFDWMSYAAADKKVKGFTLNKAKLHEIKIHYPLSLDEQRLITTKLDVAFEKIDRAIELTKSSVKLAEQLFKDELSAVFATGNETWRTGRLDSFCVLQRGHDLPKSARTPGDYKLASSSGIIDTHDKFKAKGPGVFTGRSGSIGGVFYEVENYWPLNTVLYVKEFYENEPKLIYYLIKSLDFKKYAGGTGVPTLNRNDVHSILVSLPNPKEQPALVAKLDKLYGISQELTNLYKNKLLLLASVKQSMLREKFLESTVK